MTGLFSFGAIRSASSVAKSAIEAVGVKAAELSKSMSPTAFADVLAPAGVSEAPDDTEPISRIREKLATAVTASLQRLGIALDPAITFVANDSGELRLEGDHPRAAEIEATLRDDPQVRSLTQSLLGTGNDADRRMVLHSLPDR